MKVDRTAVLESIKVQVNDTAAVFGINSYDYLYLKRAYEDLYVMEPDLDDDEFLGEADLISGEDYDEPQWYIAGK